MSVLSDSVGGHKPDKAGSSRQSAASQADDEKKNKRQLIDELAALRHCMRPKAAARISSR